MRAFSLVVVITFLATTAAQEPPAPLPILPAAAVDTTALRAALQFPLDPPDYRFRFDDTGRFEVLDRTDEAAKRIAEITASLKKDNTDAERYDELRIWHHRRNDRPAVKDCATKAARIYREKLRTDPYNADLLIHCGEALLEAEDFTEAERRLRRAVAVDPDSWRAWLLLARVQIDSAYALQNAPAPLFEDESRPTQPPHAPLRPTMPAELRVDLPPVPEVGPVPQPSVKPAGFHMPDRVIDWAEVGKLAHEAATSLDEAVAVAPDEPAVRFARCCQRKLAAEFETAVGQSSDPPDPFAFPENLADVRAAICEGTVDPDLIAVATWFEITAAMRRLDRDDDEAFRRRTYFFVCERVSQLESIAAHADGPTAARASLLAAHLCRKIGQPFRAGLHVRFAVTADTDSRPAWDGYLAALAETGPKAEYVAAARRAVDRFDAPQFQLRLADALARTGDTGAALRVLAKVQQRDAYNVPSRLAEATLRLQSDGAAALPRVTELLDAAESSLRQQPNLNGQTDCALLRACAQLIGGNAALGRMLLDDLAKREPYHPRVKAAVAAVE
jgi:tetratricopeptide (TPR) repeat protein